MRTSIPAGRPLAQAVEEHPGRIRELAVHDHDGIRVDEPTHRPAAGGEDAHVAAYGGEFRGCRRLREE